MDEITQIDGFEPDFLSRCENCDTAPVVTAVKDGRTVYRSIRCGRCTWGEQRAATRPSGTTCFDPPVKAFS